jgi:integrase
MMKTYIWPDLGHTPVGDLTGRQIERWMQSLLDRGLSTATVNQARSVLRRCLRYAVRDRLIGSNPADAESVDGVRQPHKERRTMTLDQVDKLMSYIEDERPTGLGKGYDLYGILCILLLGTGLRKGEALALEWRDFEGWFSGRPTKVRVQRALKKRPSGETYVDAPKTGASRRTVILPAFIASKLAPFRRGEEMLVFSNKRLRPLDPDKVNRQIKKLTEDAGIGRWTPHELRHTAASLMLHAGVPLTTVSKQLGHSSIRMTADVYGHLMIEDRQQVADALGGLLSR